MRVYYLRNIKKTKKPQQNKMIVHELHNFSYFVWMTYCYEFRRTLILRFGLNTDIILAFKITFINDI